MNRFKIVTLGNTNVGKTCLIDRWVNNSFRANPGNTVHGGILRKQVGIDGQSHAFQVWDTAGQDRFKALTTTYCRNASGALIVCDKSCPATVQAIPDWIALLRGSGDGDRVPIVIAANKADLTGGATTEEIAELCRANGGLQFFETSALNGMNVDEAFECLCRMALERVQAPDAKTTSGVDIEPAATDAPGQPPPAGGGVCC